MQKQIAYIDQVLGFMFEGGFARKFSALGQPKEDLEIWYKNAQVYSAVITNRLPREAERIRLVTLIEAVRFEAMHPLPPGQPFEVDLSAYEFSEDILAYKADVIDEILRQEA